MTARRYYAPTTDRRDYLSTGFDLLGFFMDLQEHQISNRDARRHRITPAIDGDTKTETEEE